PIPRRAGSCRWVLQHEVPGAAVGLVGTVVGRLIEGQRAIMSGAPVAHLVLIDPAGLRQHESEQLDIFITPWQDVIERGFHDAQHAPEYQRIYVAAPVTQFGGVREAGRTMTMRMCFKPYMFDPALQAMLGKVQAPTVLVWGK